MPISAAWQTISIPIKKTCRQRHHFRALARSESDRAVAGHHSSTGLSGHHGSLFAHYGERVEAEIISPDKAPDLPNFAETFARQSSWEWNFGQAPAFSHLLDERFTWGGVELHFDVEKGISPAPRSLPIASIRRRWKRWQNDYRAASIAPIFYSRLVKRCLRSIQIRKASCVSWLLGSEGRSLSD
jgi:hypothetical protein